MIRLNAYVENENTPEDTLDGLGNVPPWALGFGGGAKGRGQSRVFSRETTQCAYMATISIDWKLKAA